jgi:phospholipase C
MRSIVRSSLVGSAVLAGAALAATVAVSGIGCSSPGNPPEPSSGAGPSAGNPADSSPTGTVGLQLTLPGGQQLTKVNWTITGPGNYSQSGSVNVANSQTVSFLVGGIPVGSGYNISLSGTTTDGLTTCAGSTTFSIAARAITNVSVLLQCATAPSEAGSAFVSTNTFNCATWNSISASPASAIVGTSVAVAGSAIAPNPAGITYAWSASPAGIGSFDTPNTATANFTCLQDGTATVTLTVGDGPTDGGVCTTQNVATVSVTCTGHIDAAAALATATKVKHLIVIFNENISYDHYFGTYPNAQNNPGEPSFTAAPSTPVPNNLVNPLDVAHGFTPLAGVNLLTNNPTTQNSANGTNAINPFRLGPAFAETSSMNHNATPEQQAADHGLMDLFPKFTGRAGPPPHADAGAPPQSQTVGLVMAYYDGNTLQTYWNWAQQYAMNDNMWTTNFGPSTPGALNLIAGQTSGLIEAPGFTGFSSSNVTGDGNGGFTAIGDFDPYQDTCSTSTSQGTMAGVNIGMLLNTQNITWGWFQGGFNLGLTNANGTTGCTRSSVEGSAPEYGTTGGPVTVPFPATSNDYVPHHNPFQYYPATQNLTHARPTSTASVGYTTVPGSGGTVDPANHMYDAGDFYAALAAGNLPAVVYLKAPAYENGHPSNSDPLDEQNFAASVVTALQGSQEWSSSLVVLTYDDSDGWYDHQGPPIVNMSNGASDALNGTQLCNSGVQQNADGGAATVALNGVAPDGGVSPGALGRCAYGTRVPLLVISPFSKKNYIDHTLVDQSSVVKFIEDNWLGGQRIPGSFDAIAGSLQNMLTGI